MHLVLVFTIGHLGAAFEEEEASSREHVAEET
jgi:hypothetical protein